MRCRESSITSATVTLNDRSSALVTVLTALSTVNGERPERTIISCLLESLLADVRYSLRWLRKSPGFTLVAVASLAIGIGFNTALFTIVDALLFKPLPVAAPDRLVDIFTSASGFGPFSTSSYPDYLDLRAQNDVFEDIAGYSPMFAALNLDNRSRLAMGEIVTGNYFQVLGVGAARGRTLLPEDDRPGAERGRDGLPPLLDGASSASAPDAVGRTVRIRGNAYTIVGVTPAGFNGMVPILAPELWIPAVASLEVEPVGMHDTVPSSDRDDAAGTARRSVAVPARAVEARQNRRGGAREPDVADGAPRAGESADEQGPAALAEVDQRHSFPSGRRFDGAADRRRPVHRGRPRADDRVRQRRQHASGARLVAAERDRRSPGRWARAAAGWCASWSPKLS